LGVEIVPTRISILADNTRWNTGHAYVQSACKQQKGEESSEYIEKTGYSCVQARVAIG
jgi:hypothetical protein